MSCAASPTDGIYRGRKTLSIMPTFRCPAACAHCGTLSGPDEKTNIDLEVVLETIRESKKLGFYNVVFTGGEATLRMRDLLTAIAEAARLGLPTRLVTNAHWAVSEKQTRTRLQQLIMAGLGEINFSTGDEHIRFIPLDRVALASAEAAKLGLPVHVMVELRGERAITAKSLLSHPLIAALDPVESALVRAVESPWMPLDPDVVAEYPLGVSTNRVNLPSRTGCESVLQTYTLQADGRIGACCGLGLRLIPELNIAEVGEAGALQSAVQEAESDFLKLWLRYLGPEHILAWAAERDDTIQWEDQYAHHCQACQRVYSDPAVAKVIRENYLEIIGEVFQAAWIDEHLVGMCVSQDENFDMVPGSIPE